MPALESQFDIAIFGERLSQSRYVFHIAERARMKLLSGYDAAWEEEENVKNAFSAPKPEVEAIRAAYSREDAPAA